MLPLLTGDFDHFLVLDMRKILFLSLNYSIKSREIASARHEFRRGLSKSAASKQAALMPSLNKSVLRCCAASFFLFNYFVHSLQGVSIIPSDWRHCAAKAHWKKVIFLMI